MWMLSKAHVLLRRIDRVRIFSIQSTVKIICGVFLIFSFFSLKTKLCSCDVINVIHSFSTQLYDLFIHVLLSSTHWNNFFLLQWHFVSRFHWSPSTVFMKAAIKILSLSSDFFPHLHFLHVKAQGMVPFTCSPFVSSAPCRLFLTDFDVTSSSLCTCYYLSKADNWISFSRINKVLLYCIVLYCIVLYSSHCGNFLPVAFTVFWLAYEQDHKRNTQQPEVIWTRTVDSEL